MASATMSEYTAIVNKSEKAAACEVPAKICRNLEESANTFKDKEEIRDTDVDPSKQQFSNNATDLGIPVQLQNDLGDNLEAENGAKERRVTEDCKPKVQENENCDKPNIAEAKEPQTESPAISTPDDVTSENYDDDTDYIESAGDERVACIEEEYIQRISLLEQRHNELENVLERLTTAVECGIVPRKPKEEIEVAIDEVEVAEEATEDVEGATAATETVKDEMNFSRGLVLDLFVEFQHKIRNFAEDLNGVLNCSEAAIRHARVVQEWATSVQMMFEQLKEERHKIVNYIDERERNMMVIKEQFIAELEDQGKTLTQLVDDMMSHNDLQKEGEEYCRTKDTSTKRSTVEKIVDLLLKRRLEEDRSIILNLNKQSKISEMKLFIIHQQSCIQQLQEQNKELRAIIEGLMGPDDIEEENPCDTDQSGTPASVTSQEQCLLRQTLGKRNSPSLSLVSDVLYCDRGEYLPGNSTDGDVATVQAYSIGRDCGEISSGEDVVFDPLSVNYVREQCQQAEESERQAHLTIPKECGSEPAVDSGLEPAKESSLEPAVENDRSLEPAKESGLEPAVENDRSLEPAKESSLEPAVENDRSLEPAKESGSEPAMERVLEPALDIGEDQNKEKAVEEKIEDDTKDEDHIKRDTEPSQKTFEVTVGEPAADRVHEHNAAGDGADVTNEKVITPRKDDVINDKEVTPQKDDVEISCAENKEES